MPAKTKSLPRIATVIAGVIATGLAMTLAGCADRSDTPRRQATRTPSRAINPRPEYRQCLSQLGVQQASFAPLTDQYFGSGCSAVGAVQLTGITTDSTQVNVSNLGPVTCAMATTFAAWSRFGVDRAAQQILGSRVVKIETYGSYSCRNVAGTARRSGHASANAIDVSGFVLADGRRITVLDDWNDGTPEERRFLRVVHQSACKRFGTTLGPAYNAAHANHFHLEADAATFCR